MQTIIHKSAIEQTRGFVLFLRCWWMKATDIPVGLRQSVTSLVYKLHTDMIWYRTGRQISCLISLVEQCQSRYSTCLAQFKCNRNHLYQFTKNHSWLLATQKKGIGEQLNYFWYMCPIPSPWEKNKRTFFPDGKSRGPFLARAALNSYYRNNCYWLNKLATNKSSRVIVFRKE